MYIYPFVCLSTHVTGDILAIFSHFSRKLENVLKQRTYRELHGEQVVEHQKVAASIGGDLGPKRGRIGVPQRFFLISWKLLNRFQWFGFILEIVKNFSGNTFLKRVRGSSGKGFVRYEVRTGLSNCPKGRQTYLWYVLTSNFNGRE